MHPAAPAHGVAAAGLPYQILDARTGSVIAEDKFWAALAKSPAICVGEEHPNPHHHWAQLHVVQMMPPHLAKGTAFAVGLEMFQRPFQGVLNDYAAHTIDEATMLSRTDWENRWGFDFALYRPILDATISQHGAILGLNAENELVKRVSHAGLDGLTPDERAKLPDMDLHNGKHRAWWDKVMADMGGMDVHAHTHETSENKATEAPKDATPPPPEPTPADVAAMTDRFYGVQVLWDETMADTAARWLNAPGNGPRSMVIVAGNGHCHDSGIIARLAKRGVANAVSIQPIIDAGDGTLAAALVAPNNDYLFVMTYPKSAGPASAVSPAHGAMAAPAAPAK